MKLYPFPNVDKKPILEWDDVIDDEDEPLSLDCEEFAYSFPVCNHTEGIGGVNIGYTQGHICDNIPFEAELFTNDLNEVVLSVVLPWIEELHPQPETIVRNGDKSIGCKKGSVIGMITEKESYDNSVLTIGMVDYGQCENVDVIIAYNNLLEETAIITFKGQLRNGTLFYRTDCRGNDFVQILITLKDADRLLATTPLDFKSFCL